jgi:RNA polymerase sigma-70 factor (ECF subfamily)
MRVWPEGNFPKAVALNEHGQRGDADVLSPNTLDSNNFSLNTSSDCRRRGGDATGRWMISDRALLEQIAAGDQRAMKTLFARYRDRAFRFIMRLTKDEDIAEETLFETFFEVWRSAPRFEGRSTFSTWLLAIARHKALSALGRPPSIALDEEMAANIPDHGCDPERALQAHDLSEILRCCLARLSVKHTEVIDLVYYHERTIAEAAQILRLPESTVKTRMFYARQKLAGLVRAKL